jgi:TolB-like protein/Flp pilus assembly protein TadD
MPVSDARETLRFRDFELDLGAYELRRQGRPVRLERQPMDLLILLLERRRQLVTRGDIIDRLWGKDVFVDVETGVNTVVFKVRQALRDSPDAPAYVETVPGKGYRFIAPVEVVSGRTAVSRVTLAVLPVENLSGDPEREYLADGLAEDTIASLGQIDPEHVGVIGRTSIMAYKRTTKSLAEIGHELGADYLVEGSVRAENGRLRITSKLIRVGDQVQVWSESYDREPTPMLDLQRELSTVIAQQIRIRLSPERLNAFARRHTRNADAYDLYLRGRYFGNQLTPATNKRAVEYYERATALDPDYALAWSGIADAFSASPINSDVPPRQVSHRAREAAERAVRADPDLAETQTSLGYVNFLLDWNWPTAEAAFRRAIAFDPSYSRAHVVLGHVLSQMGRQSEAETALRRAREVEPLNAMVHAMSSQVAFQGRDYPAAVEHARQAIIVDPEFWIGHVQLGQAYEQLGRSDPAFESLMNAGRFSDGNSKAMSFRGHLLAKLGRVDEARDVLRTLEAVSRDRYVPPHAMALVHAGLGERDAVFEWLDRAYEARDVHLIFLPVDPRWDACRADPRFGALLARCGFVSSAGSAPVK